MSNEKKELLYELINELWEDFPNEKEYNAVFMDILSLLYEPKEAE